MGLGDTFPEGLLGRSHYCAVTHVQLKVDSLPGRVPGKFWLCDSPSMKTSLLSAGNSVPVIDLYRVQRLHITSPEQCTIFSKKIYHGLCGSFPFVWRRNRSDSPCQESVILCLQSTFLHGWRLPGPGPNSFLRLSVNSRERGRKQGAGFRSPEF